MRCLSYCTASEYIMDGLTDHLISKGFVLKHFDDVIFAKMENNDDIDIFLFPFGCITIWGTDEDQEKFILQKLKGFETDSLTEVMSDPINFEYHENADKDHGKTFIDEERNRIILSNKSEYIKLSISHALAQSVKLIV